MPYDHISLHTESRPGLAPEYAARHIGYYYAWAVSQNLHSPAAAGQPGFADLQSGRISGCHFVLTALNGGIDEHCFNETGNRFTRYYYEDEEEGYGRFIEDYFTALGLESEDGFYRVPHTPEHQQRLNRVFQAAFRHWQSSLKTAYPHQQNTT